MNESDFLQQYIEAAREASTRTRQILLVMIIASILVATACWNSRGSGWVNSRLNTALTESQGISKDTWSPEMYKLNWFQKIRAEQLSQVQVPVLGISYDVNDLGMLGGFAFVVLLIWVNYSLWHQATNLKLAFDFAKALEERGKLTKEFEKNGEPQLLLHTYQNLAMRQVLTIPPAPKSMRGKDELNIWVYVSKLLYALPALVLIGVVAHDFWTIEIGAKTNWTDTLIVLITESILLILVVILTVMCFYRWTKTYETWKTVAKEI